MKMTIEELLQTPYRIIDILPRQVPKDSSGQYFAIEEYFLRKTRITAIKQKHVNVVLKLNCYRDVALDDEMTINPSPNRIAKTMKARYVCIRVDDAMIVSEPDSTFMTLYNPNQSLLELVTFLAQSEGLFVWKP